MSDNMVTIDGKEYDFEELEDAQKYAITQIKSLNIKLADAEFESNQLRAAMQYFQLTLTASLKEKLDDG